MILDAIFLLAGVWAVVAGVGQLLDARRFIRHSGPWTRRVRFGIAELLGGVFLFAGHDHPWIAVPAVMGICLISFFPGFAVRDAVDHAALKPSKPTDVELHRRRLE